MKMINILEALSELHQKDAIRVANTNADAIHDTSDPSAHTELNDAWKKNRDAFLSKHPEAKALFAQHAGEAKRPYQIRLNNIQLKKNEVELDFRLLGAICRAALEIPGVVPMSEYMQQQERDPNIVMFYTATQTMNSTAIKEHCARVVSDFEKGIISVPKKTNAGVKLQTVRIGSALERLGQHDLLERYQEFARTFNQKDSSYDIVISGHPIDIYGMSTGRGWVSCATLDDKSDYSNNKFGGDHLTVAGKAIGDDIHNDTHIVYLVRRGGDIDHDAIARITYKKHVSATGKEVLLSDNKIYGNELHSFLEFSNKYMHDLFGVEDGIYHQCYGTYLEHNTATRHVGNGDSLSASSKFISSIIERLRGLKHGHKEEGEFDEDHFYTNGGPQLAEHISKLDQASFNHFMDEYDVKVQDLDATNFVDVSDPHAIGITFQNLFDVSDSMSSETFIVDKQKPFLENLDAEKLNSWFVTKYESQILTLFSEGLEVLGDEFQMDGSNNSNFDDELGELNRLVQDHLKFFEGKVNLRHSNSSSTRAMLQSIYSSFHYLAKAFNHEYFEPSSAKDAVTILFEEIKHLAEHIDENSVDFTESLYPRFKGIFAKLNKIAGTKTQPLDWMYQVEHKYGHKSVSTIEGLEYVKDWFMRFLVDALPSSLGLEDGHLGMRKTTDTAAAELVQKLKSISDTDAAVRRAIDMIDTHGVDLTKFLKD